MNQDKNNNSNNLNPEILYQDQDVVVINKPAGVVVNQAETVQDETIQDWMKTVMLEQSRSSWEKLVPSDFNDLYGTPEEIFQQRQGVVHRLDKDTSGVLILAKNPGSLVFLLHQFKQRQTKKEYLCLTHGKFRVPEGIIRAPIERANYDRQRMAVSSTGRSAVTKYQVEQYYSGFKDEAIKELFDKKQQKQLSIYQGFSLVHCWPKTGRTHQIRVHMKHWEHPLVGDEKYVGKKRARLDKIWCPRQFLHATRLEITHPRTHQKMGFTAPLTSNLQNIISLLTIST